jgi:hypothetical protein
MYNEVSPRRKEKINIVLMTIIAYSFLLKILLLADKKPCHHQSVMRYFFKNHLDEHTGGGSR